MIDAFALTGRIVYNIFLLRVLPWAMCDLGFQPASLELRLRFYAFLYFFIHIPNHAAAITRAAAPTA